ncbi:DUF998 domain-containing protein [Streptosporangium longisporum]|uniref:DUF998 domain-containing protein n=1 Tax=Streptosporangium longisporum TaxID=46187 RepID=A0ABN3XXS1_9ACTN
MPGASERSPTGALLTCGAVAGPLFLFVVAVQDYTREGFDPRRHLLSMLSLGDGGWVQVVNFVLAGLLNLAFAAGLWRMPRPGRGGAWGALLIGGYGAGLVGAGLFRTEPAFGYPAGAPEGLPEEYGLSYVVHGVSFFVVLLSLVAACAVFARRFAVAGDRGWALYCAAVGVALPVIYLLAGVLSDRGQDARPLSLLLRLLALVGWSWAALLAVRIRREVRGDGGRRRGQPAG